MWQKKKKKLLGEAGKEAEIRFTLQAKCAVQICCRKKLKSKLELSQLGKSVENQLLSVHNVNEQ